MSTVPAASDAMVGLTREHRFWRWNVLLSTYFGYSGFYLCRKMYTIAKPVIKEDLGFSWTQIANIWAAFLIAYMVGQFITSFLGRKRAPKTLLVGGLGLSMIVNVAVGFSNNYCTFVVFMIFNGLLQSTGWPSSVAAVAHWVRPQERGFIIGFLSTSHMVGTLVVKLVGGFLLVYVGWRWSFCGATAVAAVFWALLLWRHHDKPEDAGLKPLVVPGQGGQTDIRQQESDHLTPAEYFRLACHPVIITLGVAYLCVKFLRYALDSWIPTFLVVQMHLSPDQASYYSMGFDVCGVLPALVTGWLLDRLFKGNWALLSLVAAVGMIFGFVVALHFDTSAAAVAASFGLIGFMIFGPETILNGAATVQVAGEKHSLAVAGLVNGIGSIGPILQEPVIGGLMKSNEMRGMHNANLLCLGLCILFFFLMIVASYRRHQVRKRDILQAAAAATAPLEYDTSKESP
jgi:MFS transporter, OPA family, glycerol-3-phosphate transporter